MRLYHSLENSAEYHAEDPKFLEVTPEEAGCIETLLHEYPKFIPIDDLPLEIDAEKVGLLLASFFFTLDLIDHFAWR